MKPPGASAPPADGVNERVNVTLLPATRSDDEILNDESKGRPPITPDACGRDANGSALVCTVMMPPAVGLPMVKPVSVTVTAVAAASVPPVTVIVTELAPSEATVRVTPGADDCAVMAPEAKKPVG